MNCELGLQIIELMKLIFGGLFALVVLIVILRWL